MPELASSLTASEADRLLQAEALVRAYCGWHIAPLRTETATVRPLDRCTLAVPTLQLRGVTSVSDDGTAVASDDYEISAAGVLTRIAGAWSGRLVDVEMSHGYDAPPAEVTGVVQAIAQRAVDNPGGLVREQVGQVSEGYATTGSGQSSTTALMDAEKLALDRYRLVPLP